MRAVLSARTTPSARTVALVVAPLLLIGVLSWPLLFSDSIFNDDWLNHLWYMWHQSLALRANHLPTLFLNYSHAVFYPHYAFYGGTIYVLTGTLSLLLGNAPLVAYVASYVIAISAAYGGWYWLARSARLGRWQAHAPGVVYITSSYYLTSIYGRGAWPEVLGVSAIPPLCASALSVLRAERLRFWPALALAASSIVFFGSHNITILWGSTLIALLSAAILLLVPRARSVLTRRGVLRVAGLAIPGALVNAWFLAPAIAYQSQTLIGGERENAERLLRETAFLVSAKHLFTLSRASASGGADFPLSLPILEIAWVLVGIAIFLRTRRGNATVLRLLLVVSAMGAFVGLLMTHTRWILALPRFYIQVQFSYRLETYVVLCICGAVLLTLLLARDGLPRRPALRVWLWSLLPILAVSFIGALQETDAYPPANQRGEALSAYLKPPLSVPILQDYLDIDQRAVGDPGGHPVHVEFPPRTIHGDRAVKTVRLPPGLWVYTNLGANPNLVHVSGARIVGIDPEGNEVLEIYGPNGKPAARPNSPTSKPATETITVSAAHSAPVVLGQILSLLALLTLVLELGILAVRSRRRRAYRAPLTRRGAARA